MLQRDKLAIINCSALISISQMLEAIRSTEFDNIDIKSSPITEADRRIALQMIIKFRALRNKLFPSVGFKDPFWEIILNLYYDSRVYNDTSIKSICIESGVPIATALRYLNILVSHGIARRSDDPNDGRRSLVSLTDESINSVNALLDAWIRDIALLKLSELDFRLVDSFQV